MQCPRKKWTRAFVTLSLLLLVAPSQCSPEQIDSFCVLYTKMLKDEKDVAAAVKLPVDIKKRLLLNEQLYRDQCNAKKV